MIKKILIIILIVLLIAVVGLFIFALGVSRNSGGEVTVTESIREIVSFGNGRSVFDRNLSGGLNNDPTETENTQADVSLLRLRKLTSFPVTKAFVSENERDETVVRFIARENGNIFEMFTDSTTQKRISNTTILRIWETLWLPGGNEFIARFLDNDSSEIESFYAEIKTQESGSEENEPLNNNTSEGSLKGVFLQNNITELTQSKSKDKIFYLIPNGNGSLGIISDPDGSKKVQVFDSPLSGWQSQWPTGDKIALTTNPSANTSGYLYFLNTNTEKLEKVLSGVRGLTTLVNEDRTQVLFTHNESNRLLLSILDIESDEVTDLPIWTLAEKCIWSNINNDIIYCGVPNTVPAGTDLDRWYQGLTSFSDSIWMIDTQTQTANMLINLADVSREEIDTIKFVLSPEEDYLFFVNKKDSNLWQLKLNNL